MDCGVPSGFKFTKSKRQQGGAQSHATLADEVSRQSMDDRHGVRTQYLSQEQFTQLIQLLNHVKENKSTNTPISEAIANSVAYAGITDPFHHCIFCIHNRTACLTHIKSNSWILDSGALEHMTFDITIFSNLTPLCMPLTVNLPNSQQAPSLRNPLVLGNSKDGLYLLQSSSALSSSMSKKSVPDNSLTSPNNLNVPSTNSPNFPSTQSTHSSSPLPTSISSSPSPSPFTSPSNPVTDLFTKPLSGPSHRSILAKLGLTTFPSNLRGGVEQNNSHVILGSQQLQELKKVSDDFRQSSKFET
ncbi:hypothetical protein H5410_033342 [Solanum commersonii]|uniref:Uncharacterized protein n=1 Tax=Solanum commersonii TaxID=4109 RepID=A0A9J5YS98_SOLCO|nr:hypothetical protein H5410_033342 [Solanum commersonii]